MIHLRIKEVAEKKGLSMAKLARHKFMIKNEKQRTAETNHSPKDPSHISFTQKKHRFFSLAFKPMRQGVSQQVLDAANQMIEEYKSDLEYLKDK